ncbi:hypothetical protein LQ948_17475 [Jiella sp. MQZ9-1]|uniref:Uncharacterized protein n=1 Tax=Jiella flava TaxID=2816857 RepID=A0A939G0Z7_9HYPH|nr:hypothetical protein [Jiella flava]MBO0664366.1 hypothetical protein [Jiella flava]MCD2473002.1 hypothetical protein [Jiella flava]
MKDNLQFRSKRDRDAEIDLVRNYRDIAIPAIAAASQASRKIARAEAVDLRKTDRLIAAE